MRYFATVLCLLAAPLHAETIETAGKVSRVTLYPWGASVVRLVTFSAPQGAHEVVVSGMPVGTLAEMLRVVASDGVTVGAVNLAQDRLPVIADQVRPEVQAAKDEVKRLEAVLRDRDGAIAAIRLRADAANEQVAFLHGLGQGKAAEGFSTGSLDDLKALTKMVGEEVLALRQTALAAEEEARIAGVARTDDQEALDKAKQNLAALTDGSKDGAVLTLALETAADGPATLEITTYSAEANWQPVYDLALTGGDSPALTIDRGALVSQSSGEDWLDVDLTLSTARPAGQSEPGQVWPDLRSIESEEERKKREADDECASGGCGGMAEPVMEASLAAQVAMLGATVTYHYPTPVNLRNGVESLRLALDTLTAAPTLKAVAVPQRDETAYLVAEFTNQTPELILPGTAMLFSDGALVGQTDLPLIAAGAEASVGFGPIDGLRLTRTIPNRSQGDEGILTKSNRLDEVAVIKLENLTAKDWSLRVIDQIPFSEQDDLVVTHTATPPETTADLDGQRGILTWEFDLPAGETREIRLEHSLGWPTGMVLQ